MASEQPAARPPPAVAGLPSDGNHTNLGPFDVPEFDEPMDEASLPEIIHNQQETANTPTAATTTSVAAASKKGKPSASPAAHSSGKRARDLLRTPSASLQPSGKRSSSGKKRRATALISHVAQASQPMEQETTTLPSDSEAEGNDQPAVGEDMTAGDATADAAVPSTPPSTAAPAAVPPPSNLPVSSAAMLDDTAYGHVFEPSVGKTPEAASGARRSLPQRRHERALFEEVVRSSSVEKGRPAAAVPAAVAASGAARSAGSLRRARNKQRKADPNKEDVTPKQVGRVPHLPHTTCDA